VKVELVELDASAGEAGQDDLIALFEGRIVEGKFQGRCIREGEAPSGAPRMRFKFEGGQEYSLKIPSGRGENENGAYEIGFKITRNERRRPDLFIGANPVFLRNLPQASQTASHRPVVSFYPGRSDPFYDAAIGFWTPVSDLLLEQRSLEEIRDFLNSSSTVPTRDGMALGPFGEVNIVSHANEDGWVALPLFSGETKGFDDERLEHEQDNASLKLTTDKVDAQTTIYWRGCNVGRSQQFLDACRHVMGGQAKVFGPKYLQTYAESVVWTRIRRRRQSVRHHWEYFTENFYFDIPWRSPRRRPSLPREQEIVARLSRKYPGVATDEQWRTLVRDPKSRHDSKPNRPLLFAYSWSFGSADLARLRGRQRRARLAELKAEMRQALRDAVAQEKGPDAFDEYYWGIRGPERTRDPDQLQYVARGTKYRIEVRRPLRNANGEIVVPDLTNRDHYGHAG